MNRPHIYSKINLRDFSQITQCISKYEKISKMNKNFDNTKIKIMDSSPIWTTWSLKPFRCISLVKGLVIVNLMLIYSITTFPSLICSLIAKYLILIYYFNYYSYFFSHKHSSWIITKHSQWLRNRIHNLKPRHETLQQYTM